MSLVKKIKDKKVNFEFNKEYINVVTSKIANNDALFITNSFKEMHPADAADIIEHLSENDRENLIKLNNFKIDPEVFIELNESIQSEIIKYLSSESIVAILKNLESDDAIQILENIAEKDKNTILSSLPPKDRFALLESLSYPEDSAARIMQREFTAIPSNWSVGQTIDYLNIGDPAQYGFHPPENVKQAYIDAIKKDQSYYSASEGIQELRSAIAEKENSKGLSIDADDVLITNGVSEGLDMVMSSIVEEGDEVLLPGPYYPPYASYIRLHGGIPIEFSVDLENSTPDIADIKSKITPKTVAICLISPNNPTGAVFEENSLKKLIDVANENNLYIICDEIYDQIVFDKKFVGIGKVAGDSPVIILNGFSKVHLMPGWRIGYIAFNNSPQLDSIKEHLPKLARVRISTNHPVQYAALESLRGPQE